MLDPRLIDQIVSAWRADENHPHHDRRARPIPPIGALQEFIDVVQKEGEHDPAFAYKTSNAEVLAWIVKRASGKSLAALLSETVWQKIGAEFDAYFTVDSVGNESGGGGLHTALRDLARVGETMRLGWPLQRPAGYSGGRGGRYPQGWRSRGEIRQGGPRNTPRFGWRAAGGVCRTGASVRESRLAMLKISSSFG